MILTCVMLLALLTSRRGSLLTLKEGYGGSGKSTVEFQLLGLEKCVVMVMLHLQLQMNIFENPDINPVACIKMYFNKTESLRTNEALFITLQKLHKSSEKVTLADWINSVIVISGQCRTGGS